MQTHIVTFDPQRMCSGLMREGKQMNKSMGDRNKLCWYCIKTIHVTPINGINRLGFTIRELFMKPNLHENGRRAGMSKFVKSFRGQKCTKNLRQIFEHTFTLTINTCTQSSQSKQSPQKSKKSHFTFCLIIIFNLIVHCPVIFFRVTFRSDASSFNLCSFVCYVVGFGL